ncbi:MAG TPA: NAD(P)H-hydrate dehydratase [Pyrinomonadaceae bacterium]|nr:NAD(P)H-hydrate dehydratase [Pyrinomonadaceae bacterium]
MSRKSKAGEEKPLLLTDRLLRGWPLPQPDEGGSKEERGRVLVVGGSSEMPGACILAATAALRAGAGKLRIATTERIAPFVASAVPESRVFTLAETKSGAISSRVAERVAEEAEKVQAVVIGPGMIDSRAVSSLMTKLLPLIESPVVILDAEALSCFSHAPKFLDRVRCKTILTPHAEEMAGMIGESQQQVERNREETARRAAEDFRAVVVLKGRETLIVSAGGEMYVNRAGNVGLATSGSGDVLSGIITGLAARGSQPAQAAAWGVYLHARAGERLAERMGRLGFLARELPAEIPSLIEELS